MKIVFLCGSLQPGRDGVGDYTRRLAAELLRQKHQVAIIALHDRQLVEQVSEITQSEEEQTIPVLRLSNRLSWADRARRASAFIEAINPDWISLQYVPFAFQDKGLPFNLTSILTQLRGGRPLHIMFHELWVGMSVQSPRRHVWWGQAQRYLIRSMLTAQHPDVVHTHTPLYQSQLGRLGVRAFQLPLFTNIPRMAGLHINSAQLMASQKHKLGFVFFGGIFAGAPAKQLADEVAAYASKKKIAVDLTIIGKSGAEQETWAAAWRSHGLTVHLLGEKSPASLSEVLSQSSIGLSTTPVALAGKSGSIAAMHAHGLPVLCVSAPWYPRNAGALKSTPGVLEYTVGNFERVMNSREDMAMRLPRVDVTDVTYHLLNNLSTTATKAVTNPTHSR